jgi:NAD(P)-dependent dehydrogenase (short-subunit alcohol dehydrogenase family)
VVSLEGKVAIVAGAGRGIGAAAARALSRAGATVVVAARTRSEIETLEGEIKKSGGTALAIPADVTVENQVADLVNQTVATFGRLDIAFNNAGAGHRPRPLAEFDLADFEQTISTNLVGMFLAMKYEIPAMLAAGGGAIVNMSSTAGLQGAPGMGPYSAAKHGVIGLTKAAALDYGRSNIRINAIAPGPIVNERIAQLPEEARQHIARSVPLGRLGEVDQVAAAVVWLCSDEAAFVHGAVLAIDGGRLAGSVGPD